MKAVLETKKRKREEKNDRLSGNGQNQGEKPVKSRAKGKNRCYKTLFETDSEPDTENELCDDNSDDDMPVEISQGDQCLICDEFGKDGELWYRCTVCGLWVHSECSGWDDPHNYMCDICLKRKK